MSTRKPQLHLAIVADDFTGACDTGVLAAERGLPTEVVSFAALREWLKAQDQTSVAVSVSTESRGLDPLAAARRVREAVEVLREAGCRRFYKKIDSRIRGQVAIEIAAALEATRAEACCLAPAFPAQGRITRGGWQIIAQGPADRTRGADHAAEERPLAHLPTLLESEAGLGTAVVGVDIVRRGPEEAARAMREAVAAGARVLVADAETDDDLRLIAAGLSLANLIALAAGTAGLMRFLPLPTDERPRREERTLVVGGSVDVRTLVVCGSLDPASRAQVAHLAEQEARIIEVNPPAGNAIESLMEALASGERCVLTTRGMNPADRAAGELDTGSRDPDEPVGTPASVEAPAAVGGPPLVGAPVSVGASTGKGHLVEVGDPGYAEALAAHVAEAARRGWTGGLVLTGGQTAVAVLGALGARGLALRSEVRPGMPWGRIRGGLLDGAPVATKAGSFGAPDALAIAAEFVDREWER